MSDPDRQTSVRRRRYLGMLAGGVAAGTAGCGASIGGSGEGVEDSTSVIGHRFRFDPKRYQFNPWSYGYTPGFPSLLFEYPAVTVHGEGTRLTDLVSSFDLDGDTVTISFSDEYSWWNGDPVTARDRWVAHRIDDLLGVASPWKDVELVDEYTLRYAFGTPLRRRIAVETVADFLFDTPAWLFDEWLERLEDATTDEERESIEIDLRETPIDLETAKDDGYGCGPYEVTEVSPNRVMLEVFEDHPHADDIEIERAWFPSVGGRQHHELTREGTLDVGEGVPGGSPDADVVDYVELLADYEADVGTKISFNWNYSHFGRRNVRRAVLCALPLDELVDLADWGRAPSLQTGLSSGVAERWLGDLRERLYRYPVGADADRAAAFLERAGYERSGDGWVDPDGERLEFVFRGPRWDGWSSFVHQAAASLDEVGFDVSVNTANVTTFGTQVRTANHQLVAHWADTTPFGAYDVHSDSLFGLGYGVTDPDRERSLTDKPVTPTIPTEPGALSVDGDGREINLVELWEELGRPIDEERTAAILRLFARWWNYALPDVHVSTWRKRVWANTRDFDWPPAGDDAYRVAGPQYRVDYHLLTTGAVGSTE